MGSEAGFGRDDPHDWNPPTDAARRGRFRVKGDVVEVQPAYSETAYRITFFGDLVEFITGGTLDRLAKAKVAKGNPESDVTYTTAHVGALYQSDGLFEKLDMSKVPNAADLYPAGERGGYEMGVYSYVYSPAFRTDLMPAGFKIDSWKVLWGEAMKGNLGLPDFDPSHIVIAASVMEGKSPADWESVTDKLTALKPNIKAFYQSDATSQDLIRTGETPVQVLLSINGYHLIGKPCSIRWKPIHKA